jgi:hypothetical protein
MFFMLNSKYLTLPLLVFALFLLNSYLIPFHYHPYRSYYNDASAILGVIAASCWIGLRSNAVLRIPISVILPLFLIIIIGLQTWNGLLLFPVDSIFPILYLVSFAIALIFGATLTIHPKGLKELAFTLTVVFISAGLLSVSFQLVQLFNLNWYPYVMPLSHARNPRAFGNLGQPNLLSLLLCFSIASCWYLYVTRQIKAQLGMSFVIFLLMGLVFAQSRIGWVILPVLFLLCWHQPPDCPKVSKIALIILLGLFVSLVIFAPDLMQYFGITLDRAEQRAGQISVRVVLWKQAWAISLLHPWFGSGWFQFGAQQAMLSSLFPPTEYSDYAHNIVLGFAAEIGWLMTFLLFLAALYWAYHCCIRWWKNLQVRYMSMILLPMLLHSLVEFPLWFAYMLMPFGVIVGALTTLQFGWRDVILAKTWMVMFFISSVLALAAITWDYNRVVDGFIALAWQQAGEKKGIGSTDKPPLTLFPQFYDYFKVARISIGPKMSEEDIQFLERIALRFAFTPILDRLALAYAANQRPTEALQVLVAIQRLNGADYAKVYLNWQSHSQKNPKIYGEIFKRMPLV